MSDQPSATDRGQGIRATIAGALDRARVLWAGLPRAARVLALSALGIGLLMLAWLAIRPAFRDWAVLFRDLEREDAAAMVAKLKQRDIPYRLTEEGRAIEVPASEVYETRLVLASDGLPHSGQVGFESFDKMRLGATEFEQQAMYRRAMEGELARTIGTIRPVQQARVHLVLPKRSVFVSHPEASSASVVLQLRQGSRLGPAEVSSIVFLVAAAIPELTPDRVSVVTTDGETLHRPRTATAEGEPGEDPGMSDGDDLARARSLEDQLEERARSMLERVLGAGHVSVRIKVDLDTAKLDRRTDRYDPNRTALRSETMLVERSGTVEGGTVAGVPGAESNVGTAAPDATASETVEGNVVRRSHTRNFEVEHVQEREVGVSQTVKRLAVAVLVDGSAAPAGAAGAPEPPSQAELDKLAGLVKSVVGFNETRGDVMSIESVPFLEDPAAASSAAPPSPTSWVERLRPFLPIAAGAAVLLVLLAVVLGMRRRVRLGEAGSMRKEAQLASDLGAAEPLLHSAMTAKAIGDHRVAALNRAREDPATTALIVRQWLGTDPSDQSPALDSVRRQAA